MLELITGKHGQVQYNPRQSGDATHTVADTTAIRRELGFTPAFTLADGLRKEANWMSDLLAASLVV